MYAATTLCGDDDRAACIFAVALRDAPEQQTPGTVHDPIDGRKMECGVDGASTTAASWPNGVNVARQQADDVVLDSWEDMNHDFQFFGA